MERKVIKTMGDIFFYGAHEKAITDQSGVGLIRTKIPGSFSGIGGFSTDPVPDGRYFKKAEFWTENGAPGDLLTNIRIEDTDQILLAQAALFPSYPVIQQLNDMGFTEQESAVGGIGIPVGQPISIQAIDPHDNRGFMFIPSGLYLCADFHAGDGAINKTIRVNYTWGKYFTGNAPRGQ